MNSVEELKKLKELLDAGIITKEEFEKKKKEILSESIHRESAAAEPGEKNEIAQIKPINKEQLKEMQEKILKNKAVLKKILIGIGILAILAIAFFAGQKIVEKVQQSKRAAALETAIASIMDDYGLSVYAVKYVDHFYPEVFAEGFERLTDEQALSCLKELDEISIEDPCGDDEIDFGAMTHVHPGLDVEYSYWRVSSLDVLLNQMFAGNYTEAGIYCNQYGSTCVFQSEN